MAVSDRELQDYFPQENRWSLVVAACDSTSKAARRRPGTGLDVVEFRSVELRGGNEKSAGEERRCRSTRASLKDGFYAPARKRSRRGALERSRLAAVACSGLRECRRDLGPTIAGFHRFPHLQQELLLAVITLPAPGMIKLDEMGAAPLRKYPPLLGCLVGAFFWKIGQLTKGASASG
jgi:hypothetical protein